MKFFFESDEEEKHKKSHLKTIKVRNICFFKSLIHDQKEQINKNKGIKKKKRMNEIKKKNWIKKIPVNKGYSEEP